MLLLNFLHGPEFQFCDCMPALQSHTLLINSLLLEPLYEFIDINAAGGVSFVAA